MDILSMPSPLEIERHFFSEILFQAFPPSGGNLKASPRCTTAYSHTGVDKDGKFQVQLQVASDDNEKTDHVLYRFKISSVGIFRWRGKVPSEPDEKDAFMERLMITGLSILYSSTRNMLQTVTGSGPYHPPYLLQPVAFVPQARKV
jgi:preprotein translocase subunit SecB